MKRLQKYVDKKIDHALDHVTDRFTRTLLGEEYDQHLQNYAHHVDPSYHNHHLPPHMTSPQQPYDYPYHHHYSPAVHPHQIQPLVPPSQPSFPPQPSANASSPAPPPTPNPHATKKSKFQTMFKQESKTTAEKEKTVAVLDEVFNNEPNRNHPSILKSPGYVPFTPVANPFAAGDDHVPNHAFHIPSVMESTDAHEDKILLPEFTAKKYRYRLAIADLEHAQDAMPGPRWTLADPAHIRGHLCSPSFESTMSNLRYALSGIESGVTFSTLNTSRYNDLGDSVLDRVLVGLSRLIDLSNGVQDLHMLASQVIKRDMAAVATSIQDIRNSTVPIFAILYEPEGGGALPSIGFGIDQPHMDQLYTILHTLTAGRKARIWLADIAMLSFSKGARWERLSIIPFTLFPAIVIHGSKRQKRFGILRTVHEQVAMDCLGVIELDAPDRDLTKEEPSYDWTGPRLQFRSRVNPRVTKMLGLLKAIQDCLCDVAVDVLTGYLPGHALSLNGDTNAAGVKKQILQELRTLSMLMMRGESLSNVVLGFGNPERACKFDGHEDKVFKTLAKNSKVCPIPIKPQKVLSGAAGKWNGMVEFVGDLELGRGLGLHKMKRTYICAYNTKNQWIAALGKVEGIVELYGLLFIRRTSAQPQCGIVQMYFPNFPVKRMMPTIHMLDKNIVGQTLFGLVWSHIDACQPGTDWQVDWQADWQVVNLKYNEVRWS